MTIDAGSVVLLHLSNPTEKYWGLLEDLSAIGVTLHGLHVASFEDWVAQATREGEGASRIASESGRVPDGRLFP